MDMLEIGRGLKPEEEETHFGMWCIMSSPLLIGCDLTAIPASSLQLLKNKELIALNQDPLELQAAASFSKAYVENDYTDDDEIKIVRTKKFDIKPMYPEDACIQMELLGHNFFVFCNAETDQVNVVYKRKGDTYGLIEPEV